MILERFFYFVITNCLFWWPLELSYFHKSNKSKVNKVAYYLLRYPHFSQTFIQREVIALKNAGIKVKVFANKINDRDKLSEEAKSLIKDTKYLNPLRKMKLAKYKDYFYNKNKIRYLNLFIYIICHKHVENKSFKNDKKTFDTAIYLAGRIRDSKLKHVHAPWANKSAFVALIASKFLGISYTVQARAYDLTRSDQVFALKQKLNNANFVIVNSEYNRDLVNKYVSNKNKVKLIYNEALSLDNFCPVLNNGHTHQNQIRLLCVGRYVEQKGLTYLLKACSILKNKGVSFNCELIGGEVANTDKDYFNELNMLYKELKLEKSVYFSGALSFDHVLRKYSDADIFVLPSVIAKKNGARDNIPNAIIEAMSMKLPVVSTYTAGIPEIIENEVDGLLVQPENEYELADAIIRLIENEALRKSLGENARKKIEEKFDINKNIKEFVKLFN